MSNCGGTKFHQGHTCGDCQARYYVQYANSCTYGANYVGRQLAVAFASGQIEKREG